jgi:hypothetical protein
LVPLIPRGERFFRSSFKARSMVAGLIRRSFSLMSGVIAKSGQASKKGIWSRIRGARSFPQRYQKKAQMVLRDAITSGP